MSLFSNPGGLSDPETVRTFVLKLREGICIVRPGGDFVDANPAFLELFGARTLKELHEQRDAALLARELDARLAEGDGAIRGFEFRLAGPEGEARTALVTAFRTDDPLTGDPIDHSILFDISDRKRLESELLEQTLRDPLTGCFNRRYLARHVLQAESTSASWGCIVIDLDNFKELNDQLGHDAGDQALVRLSRFLLRRTRTSESVVRLGGDEFLLVLPGADENVTGAVADRLRLAASHEEIPPFSLGWASRYDDESLLITIERADQKLLAVKAAIRAPRRRRIELAATSPA